MLGTTWEDKINNTTIKQKNRFTRCSTKWNWVGHAARAKDNWALDIMKWNPIGKRKRGRPNNRLSKA